jgi:histidinol-phosphate aminotransferase
MSQAISRRAFAAAFGAFTGGALVDGSAAHGAQATSPAAADKPILLNSNENPYGPSAKALEAYTEAGRVAGRYPDEVERAALSAIAKHHGVAAEQVVLGCGSSEILQMADQAFAGPGRPIVAAEPTFEAVLIYAAAIRAEGVKVRLTADFRHDLPRMAAAARDAGLVYVCNPNNPTGTLVGGEELAAFVAGVPQSVTVLVDEAYHHFVEDPRYRSAVELLPKAPNLVVARTFSKIYGMAGLRLGYAVGSKERIERMAAFASFSNANAGVLAAALASLADPDLVPRQRALLNDARRWLVGEMERQGRRTMPSETNFVMIDLGRDVEPVIEAFRKRGIHVGRRFPSLSRWLRVTIGRPEELRAFAKALEEIAPVRATS